MFHWKKLGKIFNPQDAHGIRWIQEYAQAPSVIVFDTFIRIYFSTRQSLDANGQYVSYAAFIDVDRKNLFKVINISKKQVLSLGNTGAFDQFGTYPLSVIKKGKELVGYYGGWTRCESVPFNVAIGMAKSKDNGEHFVKVGEGPVLSYDPDEPFILSGPKIRTFHNRLYLWYIAGKKWLENSGMPEPVYKIRMATSDNGKDWQKQNRDLIESKLEKNECQASPDVFFYKNLYHMFFCYRYSLDYRGKEKGYRIGYASSEDLIHWVRDDAQAGINVSAEGWDSEMVAYPHVFELESQLYMLYNGNGVGKYGFGLAKLENYSMK